MQQPLRPPVMTLGIGTIRPALRRALWLPALVLVLTVIVVVITRSAGWLSVGGAFISALGARLWANRVFRVRPHRSDEGLPPPTLPPEPGARGVEANVEFFAVLRAQALDNLYSYVGVWLSIAGGIIGSAGPFILGLFWKPHP
jgi:hypothetical protein